MKEMICSFLFALVLSCLLNSIYDNGPPFPWPVGVNQVKEAQLGMKREEGNIGEMHYVDGARPVTIMTAVDDQGSGRNVDMPLGANN